MISTDLKIYQVAEINTIARNLLEQKLQHVVVEGEVSNFTRASSGHLYFSLKDATAAVSCVLFKGSRFNVKIAWQEIDNGMQVRALVDASLYVPRGQFQLIVSALELAGTGALEQEYKLRLARLRAEGLFDTQIKKTIPARSQTIGVITSVHGAAIHDVLTTLKRRNPFISVIIYPSLVQGADAPENLIAQLAIANQRRECDVLLLVRGGGSLEDLWAFNDEALVRAVVASQIPVVSGVGHETDITLVDFAADIRAATPTAAAEYVSVAIDDILHQLLEAKALQIRRLKQYFQREKQRIQNLCMRLSRQAPMRVLQRDMQHLDTKNQQLQQNMRRILQQVRLRQQSLVRALSLLSPLLVLDRGYAVAFDTQGKVIKSANDVAAQAHIQVRLASGRLYCEVYRRKYR